MYVLYLPPSSSVSASDTNGSSSPYMTNSSLAIITCFTERLAYLSRQARNPQDILSHVLYEPVAIHNIRSNSRLINSVCNEH